VLRNRQQKHTANPLLAGVASVNDFSKPAVEFAANNKIPLLSLSWFLGPNSIRDFNNLTQPLIDSFNKQDIKNFYDFLKRQKRKFERPKI
jgi:hypothetical protein